MFNIKICWVLYLPNVFNLVYMQIRMSTQGFNNVECETSTTHYSVNLSDAELKMALG